MYWFVWWVVWWVVKEETENCSFSAIFSLIWAPTKIRIYNGEELIGGSRGAPPACTPWVQILSFWHTNFSKRSRLGSWHPPRGRRPPREILDPPLELYVFWSYWFACMILNATMCMDIVNNLVTSKFAYSTKSYQINLTLGVLVTIFNKQSPC